MGGDEKIDAQIVFISGCKDDQESKEITFTSSDGTKRRGGALTFAFLKLVEENETCTLKEVIQHCVSETKKWGQSPKLSSTKKCDLDDSFASFFNGKADNQDKEKGKEKKDDNDDHFYTEGLTPVAPKSSWKDYFTSTTVSWGTLALASVSYLIPKYINGIPHEEEDQDLPWTTQAYNYMANLSTEAWLAIAGCVAAGGYFGYDYFFQEEGVTVTGVFGKKKVSRRKRGGKNADEGGSPMVAILIFLVVVACAVGAYFMLQDDGEEDEMDAAIHDYYS